ncbi:hypothetical protein C8R43DRAFT_1123434 [Mycena crocata]|nr:hypothetical protein C8R43DRAFT_1123434 [Mycena crocata]
MSLRRIKTQQKSDEGIKNPTNARSPVAVTYTLAYHPTMDTIFASNMPRANTTTPSQTSTAPSSPKSLRHRRGVALSLTAPVRMQDENKGGIDHLSLIELARCLSTDRTPMQRDFHRGALGMVG